ncbi:MAG: MarR family winged helix-turn-helix transcriptional regulator [Limosilactobacillus sp.]
MDIQKIRKFNRDLTLYLGVYDRNLFGLHYPMLALRIVMEVDNRHGVTANELGTEFSFDKGYLSRLISKLTADDLIVRKQDPTDHRRWQLFTTAKGHQLATVINQQSDARVQQLLAKIDPAELPQVLKSLALLQDALDALKKEQD